MSDRPARIVLLVRNDISRDNRLQKEARALLRAGYDVLCVGLVTSAVQQREEDTEYGKVLRVLTTPKLGPSAQTERSTVLTAEEGARVYGGVLGSLRHYLGRVRENRMFLATIRSLDPEMVICHDPDSSLAAVAWNRSTRRPIGYDAREIWTEQNPHAHWLYKWLWGMAEKRVMRRAAFCMTVNDPIASELERRYAVSGVATVYNGAAQCIDSEPSLSDPPRLFFQGSFSRDRNLLALVRAMIYLRSRAVLYLQGYGEMEGELRDVVSREGLEDCVRFVPACDPADVVASAANYDIGVICHLPTSLNHELAAPNKLFDYMAGGLAVAGSDLPVIRQIVMETGCGAVIDPSTPESLARGIGAMLDHPERVTEMKRASSRACRRYSWDRQAQKELALVARALGEAK